MWIPGSSGADFPDGPGIPIEPNSAIVLQVHYSALNGAPEPDQTAIDLRLDEAPAKGWTVIAADVDRQGLAGRFG